MQTETDVKVGRRGVCCMHMGTNNLKHVKFILESFSALSQN